MEQLRKFPFTELKMDRVFVFGASSQSAAKAIFESSVELVHRMGMVAVAEGAETEEDLLLCRELKSGFDTRLFDSSPCLLNRSLSGN